MKTLYINARFLTQPITGVQRFAIEVSRALVKKGIDLVFLCPEGIIHRKISEELNAQVIGKWQGVAWEQIDLPRYLKKKGSPLLINLANMAPLFYSNKAVVLHDVAFIRNPKWFSRVFALWYRIAIPVILKNSRSILTVSDFSAREIRSLFPTIDARLSSIGNGLPNLPMPQDLNKFAQYEPYFLAFGGNNERKNLNLVISAIQMAARDEVNLLVIGRDSASFSKGKKRPIEFADNIHFLEGVTDHDLARLYSNATALIYPSLYEGFGLPVLEAMFYGCPSIVNNLEVFHENFDDNVAYLKDASPEALFELLVRVKNDTSFRDQILSNSAEIIEKHTFSKVADRISAATSELCK
ncbi:MAG: glycosyltransferase family 1 protein [Vicingaceae bacterium]